MTSSDIHALFVRDYLIMSYLAALGAIQVSVSIGRVRGLFLIPDMRVTRALGILLVLIGIASFVLAPLWSAGPWGRPDPAGPVIGYEGKRVQWDTARFTDLPRARNINDVNGGLSGNSQSMWFAFGAFAAIATTYAISSFTNRKLKRPGGHARDGIEALKDSAFPHALGRSLRHWRAGWRDEIQALFRVRNDSATGGGAGR
ncbi:MAG: hypothetical protein HY682_07850 [Chloroflexi bacterium]|nr:hypothetical protein [Chloroflexota bacterium]